MPRTDLQKYLYDHATPAQKTWLDQSWADDARDNQGETDRS